MLKLNNKASKTNRMDLVKRNFEPALLLSETQQKTLEKNGFVHLINAITPKEIEQLNQFYVEVSKNDNFEQQPFYFNSVSFQNKPIRKEISENILSISNPFLNRIIRTENASFNLGGNFCISPPNGERGCGHHQDPCLVNEKESYSLVLWIPLVETNLDNGCLHFIAGSHLWGNHYRSMSIPWAFENFMSIFEKASLPIPTQLGDIICFDAAVIHSSKVNRTEQLRLAINIPVLTKGCEMRSFHPIKGIFNKNKVGVYSIDASYWFEESQYLKPSGKHPLTETIQLKQKYTKEDVCHLIQQFADQQRSIH